MDVFNCRISLEDASAVVRAAMHNAHLGAAPSAIFHDTGRMHARIAALQTAFPESTLHCVAIKANPVLEILREVVRAGAGLEAASIEEVHLALAADCPPNNVVFDSPAKTVTEIEQALRLGVYLNADNFTELGRIAAAHKSLDTTSLVGLRVNPMVGGGSIDATSVSTSSAKFGVLLRTECRRILDAFAAYDWLTGLHVHVGSQGCELSLLVEAVGRIDELCREITAETGKHVSHIDIGGGLPTVYRTGQLAPNPERYGGQLRKRCPALFADNVRLITEFGRAVQANCGFAASRVEYVRPAERTAVIHFGADFLLRPVYRPADWQHEFFVLDGRGQPKAGPPTRVTVAGPLCFAGDIVARDVLLPPVAEGDWIVMRDVGAYTLSIWSRHCNRCIPAVIGFDSQQPSMLRVLRAAEQPSDIVRFWSAAY
jgi:diaminopimelate decarboxylase